MHRNNAKYSPLGKQYSIECDYGTAIVYAKFQYSPHTGRVNRSNQYWALRKWFNHWFYSSGWGGRFKLMGWQTFPSGAQFLVEHFGPNSIALAEPNSSELPRG